MRKKAKFGNKKITLDGIQFDSKAEAAYYNQLTKRKKAGEIKDFDMQGDKEEDSNMWMYKTRRKQHGR